MKTQIQNLDNIEELPLELIGELLDDLSWMTKASRRDRSQAVEQTAAAHGLTVATIDDEAAVQLPGWACSAYGQPHVYMPARSSREAAEACVAEGEWGHSLETSWVLVFAERIGVTADGRVGLTDDVTRREHLITIEPEEPPCSGDAHEWRSPWEVVGGGEDNPGVSAHGGGVVILEVCRLCGWYRIEDSWAQDPETGIQGLESTAYRPPDEESLAWVASRGGEA